MGDRRINDAFCSPQTAPSVSPFYVTSSNQMLLSFITDSTTHAQLEKGFKVEILSARPVGGQYISIRHIVKYWFIHIHVNRFINSTCLLYHSSIWSRGLQLKYQNFGSNQGRRSFNIPIFPGKLQKVLRHLEFAILNFCKWTAEMTNKLYIYIYIHTH